MLQALKRLQAVGSQHYTKAFSLQQALRDAAHSDGVVNHHDEWDFRCSSLQHRCRRIAAASSLQHVGLCAVAA